MPVFGVSLLLSTVCVALVPYKRSQKALPDAYDDAQEKREKDAKEQEEEEKEKAEGE